MFFKTKKQAKNPACAQTIKPVYPEYLSMFKLIKYQNYAQRSPLFLKIVSTVNMGVARVENREGQIIFKGALPQEGGLKGV